MSDYPRRDALKEQRRRAVNIWRAKTTRKLRGGVPAPGWSWFGPVTLDTYFSPQLVTLDPREVGDYPEYKRIVGFDGWLLSGSVEVSWASYELGTYIKTGHDIVGGAGITNRVMLDEPYVITYGVRGGELIQPLITDVEGDAQHLSCIFLVETVPI